MEEHEFEDGYICSNSKYGLILLCIFILFQNQREVDFTISNISFFLKFVFSEAGPGESGTQKTTLTLMILKKLLMNFVILLTEKITRECVITGRGLDYFGKKNVSKNGKTCLSWKGSMCENND